MGSRPRTTDRRARRMLLVVASVAVASSAAAVRAPVALAAEPLVIRGASTATSDLLPSVRSGDTFAWTLTLDPDSPATELTDPWSRFNDAVVSFTLSAGDGNAGDWDPSGATWTVAPAFNVVGNANGDNLTVQLQSPDAPAMGGRPFLDMSVTLDWAPTDLDMV